VRGFWSDHPDAGVRLIRLCLFPGPLLDLMKGALAGRDA
jgi:hypothetical protein